MGRGEVVGDAALEATTAELLIDAEDDKYLRAALVGLLREAHRRH